MNRKKMMSQMVIHVILICAVVVALFPLFYIFISSFKTNAELLAYPENFWPKEITFENFILVWKSENFRALPMLGWSMLYSALVVFGKIIVASMGGYVFARGRFPFKNLILALFTSTMFIHTVGVGVYALFDILNFLNIKISMWSLILIRFFDVGIVQIFLVRGFVNSLPKSLDEAAKMDGLGFFGILVKIIAPLLKPILATIGLLAFQSSWNEYVMPSIFSTTHPEQRTLIVGITALKSTGEAAANWNLMLAGTVVALLPVLLIFIFCNRYLVSGLASGAVKE